MIPIWQDTFYYVPASASPFTYSLEISGTTIFNGKAWVAPDEAQIRINVNRVVQDYLSMDFPASPTTGITAYDHEDAVKTVSILDENNNTLSSWTFVFDWSYDTLSFDNNGLAVLSDPVNGHSTIGMWHYKTFASETSGVVYTQKSLSPAGLGYDNNYCGEYALYYCNRNGGWDSLLIEGDVRREDDFDRHSISTVYNNNSIMDWGKRNYNNQISPTWEVNTGWLTDSQSLNLARNLLSSNSVYFHDLDKGKVIPVILTDAKAIYKTHRNQKRMVNHTISITASQSEQIIG